MKRERGEGRGGYRGAEMEMHEKIAINTTYLAFGDAPWELWPFCHTFLERSFHRSITRCPFRATQLNSTSSCVAINGP